jgi:hypothetical protein
VEWFKSLKHLSTRFLIDILNFVSENIKSTSQTIIRRHIKGLLFRRKWLRSLSSIAGQELWLLYRRMQMRVLSRRRSQHFLHGVLELWLLVLRRGRRNPSTSVAHELWLLVLRR